MVVGAGQLIVMRQGGMVRPACQSAARETGLTTIGLLGSDGGLALAQCDLAVIVPSEITGRESIKLAPPLCITQDALLEGVAVFEQAAADCIGEGE